MSPLADIKDGSKQSTTAKEYDVTSDTDGQFKNQSSAASPGTLPHSADDLSNAATSLLKRLLEPDPKVRLKNIRQLQQTAFYMGFNFEHVKAKKVSPRTIFERYFPNNQPITEQHTNEEYFASFDQFIPL